jgi:hypothetical protein
VWPIRDANAMLTTAKTAAAAEAHTDRAPAAHTSRAAIAPWSTYVSRIHHPNGLMRAPVS